MCTDFKIVFQFIYIDQIDIPVYLYEKNITHAHQSFSQENSITLCRLDTFFPK